jgi:hypothetical protein
MEQHSSSPQRSLQPPVQSSLPSVHLSSRGTADDRCSAIQFARLVWAVSAAARVAGLLVPGFKDAPVGSARHLRRRPGFVPVVVLAVRGRCLADVQDDIVAGVLAVNRDSQPADIQSFLVSVGARQVMLRTEASLVA